MKAKSTLGALQTIIIGVVSAAAVFVLHRAIISEPAPPLPSGRSAVAVESSAPFDSAEQRVSAPPAETETLARADSEAPAEAEESVPRRGRELPNPHVEALRSPSPIYRNVSLMTVIREAGYVCTDILSSAAGDDALATWRVSCEDAQAYLIAEDGAGGLRVEPIAYFEMPVRPRFELVPAPPNTAPPLLPAPR